MRFEGRELPGRIEAVAPGDLAQGSVYFLVTFADQDQLLPTLEPVEFVGKREASDAASDLSFQLVGPYGLQWGGISLASGGPDLPFDVSVTDLADLFTFDGALTLMMQCSLRRQGTITAARNEAGSPSWFAGRDLPLHERFVAPGLLSVGSVYFSVIFNDDAMLIPTMKPFVFVGKDLESEASGELYFQDLPSYREGARLGGPAIGRSGFIVLEPEAKPRMFDYEGGLDELLWCSLRRSTDLRDLPPSRR